MTPQAYRRRFYQSWVAAPGLTSFRLQIKETELHIQAEEDLTREACESVLGYRHQIESYIASNRHFMASLSPVPWDVLAPAIVQEMIGAGHAAGVGPMASVAGAIAERVGQDLIRQGRTTKIVVENGGDIFVALDGKAKVGIYAGRSPLSLKVGVTISSAQMPVGVCTSSGTVGHSLSFGHADAVTVVAKSTALADAAATAVGNIVKTKTDVDQGLQLAARIDGISGVVIIVGDVIGAWGEIELTSL